MIQNETRQLLIDLSNLKHSWYTIAGIVLTIRNDYNSNTARRIREAAEHSGYTPNTLTRMASVREFYDVVAQKHKVGQLDPNTVSFPSLEIVKRLYQEDPEKGDMIFLKVLKGEIKHKELREKYDQVKIKNSGYSTGHVLRKEMALFEQKALEYIKSDSKQLFGDDNNVKYIWSSISNLADIFVTASTEAGDVTYGVLFKIFSTNDRPDRTESFFCRLIAHINFFDVYWIMLPSNTNINKIRALEQLLDCYYKTTCGILLIPWQDDSNEEVLKVLRYPRGKPVPDLRGKNDILTSYLNDLHRA